MVPTVLPLDIIDIIVGELHDDVKALRSCSTVAHSFLAPSRRRLFATVVLTGRSACQRLYNVISHNRRIVLYIRKLTIYGILWKARTKSFAPLLQFLADAEAVRVVSLTAPTEDRLLWTDIARNRKQAFINLLRSPSVESVSFYSVLTDSFPVQLFAGSPGLTHITFFGGVSSTQKELKLVDKLSPAAHFEPRELHSLNIGGIHARRFVDFLTADHSSLRVSRLRELSLYDPELECTEVAWDVMRAAKETLTSIVFDHRHDLKRSEYNPINLRSLPHLRSVTFKLPIMTTKADAIFEWLQESGLPPNLEQLCLVIEHDRRRFLEAGGTVHTMDEMLVDIISRESHHARRLGVGIEFRLWVSRRHWLDSLDEREVYDRLWGLFPLLSATGKLSLRITCVG